jgi:hypothetical protein
MRTQDQEAGLRSLDRRRMREIFAPLDADEPLPRELLIEQRWFKSVGRRELAGLLWLPALLASLAAIGVAVVLLAALWLFAQSDKP